MTSVPDDHSTNPYAPPAVQDPVPPAGRSDDPAWHLNGELLSVRHGGYLPRVDLLEGRTGCDLLPSTLVASAQRSFTVTKSSAAVNTVIHHYVSREAVLANSRSISRWHPVAVSRLLLVAAAIVFFLSVSAQQKILTGLLYVGISSLLGRVYTKYRPITGVYLRDGWIRLRRVAPAALHQLEILQRQPPVPPADPVPLRVYRVHNQRFPLSLTINGQWRNPLVALRRLFARIFKPASLEGDTVHPSQRIILDPATLPLRLKQFIEAWRSSSPGFAAWEITEAFRTPHFAPWVFLESVQLHSPDLQHSVIIALSSTTLNSITREDEEWNYGTFLESGQIVVTTTSPTLRNLVPSIEANRWKGPREKAWDKHLQSIAGRQVLIPAKPAEWIDRHMEIHQLNFTAMEALGYIDPPREVQAPAALLRP